MKKPVAEWRKDLRKRKPLPVKVMRDGKEHCNLKTGAGRSRYQNRTDLMAIRQGFLCGSCGKWMDSWTFDHENGRGAGKRDDRIEVKGIWQNAALHLWCNSMKGSGRIPYLPHARNSKMKSRLGDS